MAARSRTSNLTRAQIMAGQLLPAYFRGEKSILLGDSTANQTNSGYSGKPSTNITVTGGVATLQLISAIGDSPGNYIQAIPPSNLRTKGSFVAQITAMSANDTVSFAVPPGYIADQVSDGSVWTVLALNQMNDGAWLTWLSHYSKVPLTIVGNFAIGGTPASDVIVQAQAAIDSGLDFSNVFIETTYNDINTQTSAAGAFSAVAGAVAPVLQVADRFLALGKTVVIATPSGLTTAITGYTYKNAAYDEIRKRFIAAQRTRPGLLLADLRSDLVETDGSLVAGATSDGLHKLGYGGQFPGKVQASRLASFMPLLKGGKNSAIDDAVTNAWPAAGQTYPNVLKNGSFQGSSALSGTGIVAISPDSGATIPTSWTVNTITAGYSVGVRAGVAPSLATNEVGNVAKHGFALRLQCTASGVGQFAVQNTTSLGIQAGKWHRLRFRMKALADAVNLKAINVQLYMPSFIAGSWYPIFERPGGGNLDVKAGEVIEFVSTPMYFDTAPASSLLYIYTKFSAAGSSDMELSCAGCDVVDNPFA